jgi:Flp pilus assembly pilin Flp
MTKIFIRFHEFTVRNTRGQTMTEYTPICGAIAVAVFCTYLALGNTVSSPVASL